MKKKSLTDSKLSLNKKAISKLDDANLENIQGGVTFTCCTEVIIKKPSLEEAIGDVSVHYSCK
ncbi:hypothetical protein SAMN05421820_101212 [Pedobacter steynii]|uniref:Uncharacterized protein n=1 Tax=Pedobacter steynii TaxID=430522 RepID=A0A1G9JBB0_9SPHI|nr:MULTISPECIES: class I lanthipeptide [Pedobacter]NQX38203.1 hypothetical protein [Pedobacter steynii]RQO69847.1 hypothetical protein DBR43_17490 [Pedobacter sp. KBW06]SDL34869.1 hypothetical protein SAMN05421820_101212 [Pedobacter steynii]